MQEKISEILLRRKEYWDQKYAKNKNWPDDIHFAIFQDDKITKETFVEGVKLNTEIAAFEILESSSVYALSHGAKILDFGCGSGDLLIRLSSILRDAQCYGIDLSEAAISNAQARKERQEQHSSTKVPVEFYCGGVEVFESFADVKFDVIICRDMFYLLQKFEQDILIDFVKNHLQPTGVFFISDLTVVKDGKVEVEKDLIERQYGGEPITWEASNGEIKYSIEEDVVSRGLFAISEPQIHNYSVAWSYQAAAKAMGDLDSPDKKNYQNLSRIASITYRHGKKEISKVPYVKFFFAPKCNSQNVDVHDRLGFRLHHDFVYALPNNKRKVILREGVYSFPAKQWILIIGKSGVGKSTLLNILANLVKNKFTEVLNLPETQFYLQQAPVLIDQLTVEDNIALYAKDRKLVHKIATDLGLSKELRSRKTGQRLSGGEKQRVALGQALASEAELLLLDEPCTGLDKVIKYQFFSLIKNLFNSKDISLVCVDHDYYMIEPFFDSIYEINNGNLYLIK